MPNRFAFLDHDRVIAFAHRGGAGDWPENTLPAFQNAVDLGYRYVETDVHVSADGVLFAFHDNHLGRVTDTDAYIADLTASEIAAVRVAGTEAVPRFEDLLLMWPELRVNVDPKSDAAVDPLIRTIESNGVIDRVCVGSFSDRRIARCRDRLGPALCTSMGTFEVLRLWLASRGLPTRKHVAACAQIPIRAYGRSLADRRLLDYAHSAHLDVHIWTIDAPGEMIDLLNLGVDGIMTDRPAVLRDVLADRGEWTAT